MLLEKQKKTTIDYINGDFDVAIDALWPTQLR